MEKPDWIRGLMVLAALVLFVASATVFWALRERAYPWISEHPLFSAIAALALGVAAIWLLRSAGIETGFGDRDGGGYSGE